MSTCTLRLHTSAGGPQHGGDRVWRVLQSVPVPRRLHLFPRTLAQRSLGSFLRALMSRIRSMLSPPPPCPATAPSLVAAESRSP